MKEEEKICPLSKETELTEKLLQEINNLMEVLSPDLEKVDKERLEELIANPLFELYLLEIAGDIAGMVSLHYIETLAKKSAWVEDVVIHPKHQGKGLGKKIMKHVIGEAKKKGVKHIDLTSNPRRVAANHFYRKLKFEPRETNVYRLKV